MFQLWVINCCFYTSDTLYVTYNLIDTLYYILPNTELVLILVPKCEVSCGILYLKSKNIISTTKLIK